MPNLVHLAVLSDQSPFIQKTNLQKVVGGLLSQIVTLTLFNVSPTEVFSINGQTLPNLKHLSLGGIEDSTLQALFTGAKGLKLKTLHLGVGDLLGGERYPPSCIKLTTGEEESLTVEKLVVYGTALEETIYGRVIEESGVRACESVRTGDDERQIGRSPLLYLDGSCAKGQEIGFDEEWW